MKTWDGKQQFRHAHIKRDGWMIMVKKSSAGVVQYLTKGFKEKDLSFIPGVEAATKVLLPNNTELYCELWRPGCKASYVSTGLVAQDQRMRLDVFAVARAGDNNLRYDSPLSETKIWVERYGMRFIEFYDRENDHGSLGSFSDVAELPIDDVMMEGYVLKHGNMTEHFKYKPFKDCTLRIVGTKPGKGKYTGMVGSLECALECGKVVISLSGMTDEERWMMTNNDVVGRLIDVKYQYVNTQGRLRHASFVRFREDKEKADVSLLV